MTTQKIKMFHSLFIIRITRFFSSSYNYGLNYDERVVCLFVDFYGITISDKLSKFFFYLCSHLAVSVLSLLLLFGARLPSSNDVKEFESGKNLRFYFYLAH